MTTKQVSILLLSNVRATTHGEFKDNPVKIILSEKRKKVLPSAQLIQLEQADWVEETYDVNKFTQLSPEHFVGCITQYHKTFLAHGIKHITSLSPFGDEGDTLILYADICQDKPRFHLKHVGDGYLDYFNGWHHLITELDNYIIKKKK